MRQFRWLLALGALGVLLALGIAPAALAASASITSAGPLTNITISDELNCSVSHTGDTFGEFYGNTACATEIAVGGTLYGPSSIPAGNSPGGYVPVSQSAVTGTGTNVDPFTIVTVDDVGTTGLRITETDSYVVGQEAYTTKVQIANTGTQAQSVVLYRGGDCFLQNSDEGFGSVGSPAGSVACVAPADPNNPGAGPGSRIEQWVPLTAGSHYIEAFYNSVWNAMSSMTSFPDTCDCATFEDNGAGLSWALSIPAGQSQSVSHLTNFSPAGNVPLSTTKTADQGTVGAGGQDGYTITVSNPNTSAVQLASVTDTLPAGFSYVAGSTTGVTTTNPAVSSQTLTWSGPFTVSAASGSTPGTATLHFNVTVSTTPGQYFNNATADAGTFAVTPTGNTAPVTVSAIQTTPTTLTVNSATGDFADPTTVSAVLKNSNTSSPIAAKSVTLTLNGVESCTATTDSTGTASCQVTPGEAAGNYTLAASFAGDSTYQASTGSASFVVTHEETALAYTGATSAVNGQPVTLSAVLTTDDPAAGTALAGKAVVFTLGTGGTAQTCTGTTNVSGSASCTIASVSQTAGSVPVAASFAGDTFYQSASASSSINVFAVPATGAFVIGDRSAGSPTVGAAVNFWGAQWARNNSLSGGSAPSAMKGFADSPTSVTCGATWTTHPGNSSAPPATIPSQIYVIVSSNVTRSGSTFSGTILHIVIVQVDPGYGPDPGHAGTGTIVGTVC